METLAEPETGLAVSSNRQRAAGTWTFGTMRPRYSDLSRGRSSVASTPAQWTGLAGLAGAATGTAVTGSRVRKKVTTRFS